MPKLFFSGRVQITYVDFTSMLIFFIGLLAFTIPNVVVAASELYGEITSQSLLALIRYNNVSYKKVAVNQISTRRLKPCCALFILSDDSRALQESERVRCKQSLVSSD